jgi:hypothetical protein
MSMPWYYAVCQIEETLSSFIQSWKILRILECVDVQLGNNWGLIRLSIHHSLEILGAWNDKQQENRHPARHLHSQQVLESRVPLLWVAVSRTAPHSCRVAQFGTGKPGKGLLRRRVRFHHQARISAGTAHLYKHQDGWKATISAVCHSHEHLDG